MKVEAKVTRNGVPTSKFSGAEGTVRHVNHTPPTGFCCSEMKEAWDDDAVGFGDFEGYGKDVDVNIRRCHPYPEGAVWSEYAIKFCPFCAESVEVVLTEAETC